MKKKEGFEGVPATFFAYEGHGGGEEEAGFYWEYDDLPFSPRECPRELKCSTFQGCLSKAYCVLFPLL